MNEKEEILEKETAADASAAENPQEGSENWDTPVETVESDTPVTEAAEALAAEDVLQKEIADLKDQLLRKEADFQNYRKRMAREVSDARRVGLVDTINPFLQLFDLFEMAMKAADSSDNIAALKQGLEMIMAQYVKTIDELGVQKFDAVGETFDPLWHDAVAYENSEDTAEGVIIKQWNCGYKLGDRLLRPARVIVSSGAAPAQDDEPETAGEK